MEALQLWPFWEHDAPVCQDYRTALWGLTESAHERFQ